MSSLTPLGICIPNPPYDFQVCDFLEQVSGDIGKLCSGIQWVNGTAIPDLTSIFVGRMLQWIPFQERVPVCLLTNLSSSLLETVERIHVESPTSQERISSAPERIADGINDLALDFKQAVLIGAIALGVLGIGIGAFSVSRTQEKKTSL